MAKDEKKRKKKDKDQSHDPKPPNDEEKEEERVESQKKNKKKKNKKQKLQHDGDEETTLDHDKASSNHDKKNKKKKNNLITDARFASAHFDPRFQRVPKRESKVTIDSRFARMLSDKNFASSSAPVDKRGKPKKGKEVNPLLHYYLHQEEEEEEEDKKDEEVNGGGSEMEGGLGDSESNEDLSSSTDNDDDDEDDDEDDQYSVNSDFCRYLIASHEGTPLIEQETHRLAVVNMDWDHIKAVDLYVVMSSCLPKGGQILSVGIYPSEFGLKCMEVEAVHGPASLLDDNEENSNDESKIDDEKLRAYELNKLKYYFAVVICDSSATANHIYKNLDGTEFLRTSNVFDLRFIPDTMEFKHSPCDITTEIPTNYKEPDFQTRALQQSKVKLTWEEDEPHRTRILRRKFNPDQLDELNEYLASSGESDDGDEKGETDDDQDGHDGEVKKRMDKERLRALLLSEEGSGSDQDDDKDMEITFNTGLEDLSKHILEKKDKKSETVWEQVLRKRNEKKKARKNQSKYSSEDDSRDFDVQEATDQPDDFFMEEESLNPDLNVPKDLAKSKEGRNSKKGREVSPDMDEEREASKAELELLFAEDQEGNDHGHKGYNLRLRKVEGKKGKEVSAADKLSNVDISDDPRFLALFTSPLYALDPTDPQFKRSATYVRQQSGKLRTARKTDAEEDVMNHSGQEKIPTTNLAAVEKERFELSSTVRSLKKNLGNVRRESKGR